MLGTIKTVSVTLVPSMSAELTAVLCSALLCSACISQSEPIRVLVTGAAGQIAYSLLFSIAKGDVFGKEQVQKSFVSLARLSHTRTHTHCPFITHALLEDNRISFDCFLTNQFLHTYCLHTHPFLLASQSSCCSLISLPCWRSWKVSSWSCRTAHSHFSKVTFQVMTYV